MDLHAFPTRAHPVIGDRHLRERQHSVQQRDEVMPSKRGSYSIRRPVPAPASVSPFHLRRGQVSPPLSAVPSLLLRASLSCPPPCSSFPSFLPSFLSQQHTGRSAPGHVAAYSHCCLFFTSLPPRELLCLRKLSGRVQTPGLIQPGVFRRGQTLRRTSPIYLVFTARFVERPCNAEMLNYPRIVARLLKISPRGGDIAPRFFAQYSQEIL